MTALVPNIRGQKRRPLTRAGEAASFDDPCLLDAEVDELDQEQLLKLIDAPAATAFQGERQ